MTTYLLIVCSALSHELQMTDTIQLLPDLAESLYIICNCVISVNGSEMSAADGRPQHTVVYVQQPPRNAGTCYQLLQFGIFICMFSIICVIVNRLYRSVCQ